MACGSGKADRPRRTGKPDRSAKGPSARDIAEKSRRLNKQLRELQAELAKAQRSPMRDDRRVEALRRRRLALMLDIDRTQRRLEKAKMRSGKRVVQGPKGGVRTVLQGGSPGLGKRR